MGGAAHQALRTTEHELKALANASRIGERPCGIQEVRVAVQADTSGSARRQPHRQVTLAAPDVEHAVAGADTHTAQDAVELWRLERAEDGPRAVRDRREPDGVADCRQTRRAESLCHTDRI